MAYPGKRAGAIRRKPAGPTEESRPLPVPSTELIRVPDAGIPRAEMALLTGTAADAFTLGGQGRHAHGCLLLLKGITQAKRTLDRGVSWGAALAALYSQELHRYCAQFPDAS